MTAVTEILASVGEEGTNRDSDVSTVQTLLNSFEGLQSRSRRWTLRRQDRDRDP